jgi:hypothetical protein
MAVDIEALKALGMSDKEINQLISIEANGFPSMTATPQPVTNRVAGAYDYTPLYGAGEIIPGLTADIFRNLGIENPNVPVFRLLGSENKGGTNVNESMNFAAQPGQSFRLVNKATGAVLGEAATPEGISALVAQSNALSKSLGKKADLSFEQSTGGAYSPIFKDEPNILFDTPMKLIAAGMLAATGAGLLQPGGLGGVGATSATGATGATGVAGATTAASTAPAIASTAPAIFEAAPIIVTGTGATSAAIPAAITAAAATPSLLSSAANAPAQPPASTAPPATAFPEELIVTAKDAAPVTFGNVAPVLLPSVGAVLGSSIASTATPDLTQTPEKKGLLDRLTSNMGITDYLTVASLLGSGVSNLLGGGGGAGTTAGPYVSPFGSGLGGAGFGAGQDMRVNPNISDYERYGFGPEASFFAPGYSQLVSGAAGAPSATTMGPQGAMVNPQYVPLI